MNQFPKKRSREDPVDCYVVYRLVRHNVTKVPLCGLLFNAYRWKNTIDTDFGLPATGFVPFDDVMSHGMNLIDAQEMNNYYESNNSQPEHANSLAHVLTFSRAEARRWGLLRNHKGFQVISTVGLNLVPLDKWEAISTPPVANMSEKSKQDEFKESSLGLQNYLTRACEETRSVHASYNDMPAVFHFVRQIREVGDSLCPKVEHLLSCTPRNVKRRLRVSTSALPVEEIHETI